MVSGRLPFRRKFCVDNDATAPSADKIKLKNGLIEMNTLSPPPFSAHLSLSSRGSWLTSFTSFNPSPTSSLRSSHSHYKQILFTFSFPASFHLFNGFHAYFNFYNFCNPRVSQVLFFFFFFFFISCYFPAISVGE